MKILIATDGSNHAENAATFATRLFPEDVHYTILAVMERQPFFIETEGFTPNELATLQEIERRRRGDIEASLLSVRNVLPDVTRVGLGRRDGNPAEQILEHAEKIQADWIVLGSRGHSALERFFLGSVAARVAEHASCSVLVTRNPDLEKSGPLKVLLAFDGSENAEAALEAVGSLPGLQQGEVTVASVLLLVTMYGLDMAQVRGEQFQAKKDAAEANLNHAVSQLEPQVARVEGRLLEAPKAGPEILKLADDLSPDLLVVGARGHSTLERLFLGTVSHSALRRSKASVLVVRPRA